MDLLKMHFLLKIGIFHCYVSWLGKLQQILHDYLDLNHPVCQWQMKVYSPNIEVVPKMKVPTYISCMDTEYVRESPPHPVKQPYKVQYLHSRYLKCLVSYGDSLLQTKVYRFTGCNRGKLHRDQFPPVGLFQNDGVSVREFCRKCPKPSGLRNYIKGILATPPVIRS